MSVRSWSNDFISGYDEIDEQHKSLFELINVEYINGVFREIAKNLETVSSDNAS